MFISENLFKRCLPMELEYAEDQDERCQKRAKVTTADGRHAALPTPTATHSTTAPLPARATTANASSDEPCPTEMPRSGPNCSYGATYLGRRVGPSTKFFADTELRSSSPEPTMDQTFSVEEVENGPIVEFPDSDEEMEEDPGH